MIPKAMNRWCQEGGIPILCELLRYPFGRSNFVLPTLITMLSESILRKLPLGFDALLLRFARLRESLDAQLGDSGVILHPPYSRPRPSQAGAFDNRLMPNVRRCSTCSVTQ